MANSTRRTPFPRIFLQIWIVPATTDEAPSYQQFAYEPTEKHGRLRLMAGPERHTNPRSAVIRQDARMYAAVLGAADSITHRIPPGRHACVQCVGGGIGVNDLVLDEGDGVAISDEAALELRGTTPQGGELLLFDLA